MYSHRPNGQNGKQMNYCVYGCMVFLYIVCVCVRAYNIATPALKLPFAFFVCVLLFVWLLGMGTHKLCIEILYERILFFIQLYSDMRQSNEMKSTNVCVCLFIAKTRQS